jgi:MFS family permease
MRKDLKEVYANLMIDRFANNMVMVFIPIYLLIIGYDLISSLAFVFMSSLVALLFTIPAGFIASRTGLKHCILYRTPMIIVFIIWLEMMPFMEIGITSLIIAALIRGVSSAMYWIPLNSEFVKNSKKSHSGSEVGLLLALPVIVSVSSPLIGGFILDSMGSIIFFSIFIILIIISVIPLFMSKDYKNMFNLMKKDITFRLGHRFNLGFMIRGITEVTEAVIWPLYIYLTFQNIVFTGIMVSMAAVGASVITIFAGRLCDKFSRNEILRIGTLGYSVTWTLRYFATTEMHLYVLSFMGGVFAVFICIPLFASFCDISKHRNILNDISMRDVFIGTGWVIMPLLLILGLVGFQQLFLVVAAISLLMFLVNLNTKD